MADVTLQFRIPKEAAFDFSQLVKRLCTRSLGCDDLNLVTADELDGANEGLLCLRDALAEAGYSPR